MEIRFDFCPAELFTGEAVVTVRLGASGSTEDNTSVEALRLIMPLKLSARDLLADLTAVSSLRLE